VVERTNDARVVEDAACRARVLVIDDEPLVGAAIARVLRRGHDVTLSQSAQDALALLRSGREFDLVLCDIAMPAMSGIELYREAAKLSADLAQRFVFVTGGAFTLEAAAFLRDASIEHVIKPFENAVLRRLAESRARR
jgi:CheY-like chemotaxis protein